MATLSAKAKQAYIQYSKRMCTAVAVFWMLYRILVSLLIFFRSDVSTAFIKLTEGVDTVMIVNMSAYTTNSLGEKVSVAWVNRHKNTNDDEEENNKKDEKDNG